MLTSIKIEKLFDIFDYDIELKKEGVTILTGPNGYGKTTVLKILDALASQNEEFFAWLLFKKIVLVFSGNHKIILEKRIENGGLVVFLENGDTPNPHPWISASGGSEFYNQFQFKAPKKSLRSDSYQEELTRILSIIPDVYFIREQRLLQPVEDAKARNDYLGILKSYKEETVSGFRNTIEEYAKELSEIINETLAKSSQINQEIDSSFPARLFDQEQEISEEEFKQRFDKVKQIQKLLNEYGLSDIKSDSHPTYRKENAKALSVYINDTEQKLAVFAELLSKLRLFTEILNERRFTFKRIAASKKDGFKFSTNEGKPLVLGELSSGEQHEVVLLYELLFKVKPGTLVLIDEPELSLHVVWQKQFLDDLFKIIELQKINIIVATHSPQIINNHWDLTVDLELLRDAATSN